MERNLLAGAQVGQYSIQHKLGTGGMGDVYEAEDTRLKRAVALKVLREDTTTRSDDRHRLLHEARAASSLNHPNIVQIYGFERHGESDYIVMELVRGAAEYAAAVVRARTACDDVHFKLMPWDRRNGCWWSECGGDRIITS
jgi:serine/threonine protein kinase